VAAKSASTNVAIRSAFRVDALDHALHLTDTAVALRLDAVVAPGRFSGRLA
jgi:hypothetical protein